MMPAAAGRNRRDETAQADWSRVDGHGPALARAAGPAGFRDALETPGGPVAAGHCCSRH